MAKFMVVVNGKWMVMVEANSAGGAEHVILDDIYYGIQSSQAFDAKSMRTDTFLGFMNCCETVSLDWLKDHARAIGKIQDMMDSEKEKLALYEKQVKEYDEQIEALKKLRAESSSKWRNASSQITYLNIKATKIEEEMGAK